MAENTSDKHPNASHEGSLVDTPEGYHKCIEVINLILDGEADYEALAYFEQKIKCCQKSMRFYDLERTLKEVVKQKIENKEVPTELLEKVRKAYTKGSDNC